MRVAYHPSYATSVVNGGALRYYEEISRLFASRADPDLEPVPHDFFSVALGPEERAAQLVKNLGPNDVLVSAIGPFAHLYHYLRERHGGRFRIVRDVRTSSWAGYLLQESLAGPLTRPGDRVLFPSEFCRAYFQRLFPASLTLETTRVAYPLGSLFPKPATRRSSRHLRVGYLGRFARDKNVRQLMSIFGRLLETGERSARLHLAGPVDGQPFESFARRNLFGQARGASIPTDRIRYFGNLGSKQIWKFLAELDVLLFPAMASVESMGRIILESLHAGVRVVAANYAAAPELLDDASLIRSHYHVERSFETLQPFSFGRVCEEDAVARILAGAGEPRPFGAKYRWESFRDIVRGDTETSTPVALNPVVSGFLRSLRVSGIETYDRAAAMDRLDEAWPFFRRYNDNRPLCLLALSFGDEVERSDLERSLCRMRLLRPWDRMVLAHARQHCRYLGFRPSVSLEPQGADVDLLAPAQVRA